MEIEKLIVLIPAYNPDNKLISLIDELKSTNKFNIIVVNDGSDNEYQSVFNDIKNDCVLLSHKENIGKGAALKTGLKYIKKNYNDGIIVTMDADGQHTIKDAIKISEYCNEHKDCLVLGSRKLDKKVPLRSKIGNGITRFVFRLSTGVKVYDTQTGLRAFDISLLDKMININGDRYEYEMNVLLTFSKHKIPIKELTIKTIYIDNNSSSHFNTIKDSYRIYKEIIKNSKTK